VFCVSGIPLFRNISFRVPRGLRPRLLDTVEKSVSTMLGDAGWRPVQLCNELTAVAPRGGAHGRGGGGYPMREPAGKGR
jgi:hypothetical protein